MTIANPHLLKYPGRTFALHCSDLCGEATGGARRPYTLPPPPTSPLSHFSHLTGQREKAAAGRGRAVLWGERRETKTGHIGSGRRLPSSETSDVCVGSLSVGEQKKEKGEAKRLFGCWGRKSSSKGSRVQSIPTTTMETGGSPPQISGGFIRVVKETL